MLDAETVRAASLASPQPTFTALRAAFVTGHDSPSAYMERCIGRLAAAEHAVQAFVTSDAEGAHRLAEEASRRYRFGTSLSPIDGIPLGVKDIVETYDFPTQMGSELFAGWESRRDAACVHALRAAGAIVLGKTATTEFAVGRAAPTRNPHDLRRTPAGSSSGSAAAVAAGMVPVALGTQTQSSTLRPAAFCGVIGYKPSFGQFDLRGVHPLAPSHDHLGLLASSLADLETVATVLGLPAGAPPQRQTRLAFLRTAGWTTLDVGAKTAFQDWLDRLPALGLNVISEHDHAGLAALEAELVDADEISEDILAYEMRWPFASYARSRASALGERVRGLLERGLAMGRTRYDERLARRESMRSRVAALAGACDGFVTLAASGTAPVGLENTGARSFPIPWSLVGGPSLSLPLLAHDGLPLGVQIMAAPGADRALFGLARWLMQHARATAEPSTCDDEDPSR
jgi:Asp-tRNA(Asn)/Glu-tRNA(Gln) amidotransferase A subunit family amidase